MSSHEKEQLLTTTIHIKSADIYRTKNINGLIHNNLKKTIEGYCGKYGYVIPDTLKIIKELTAILKSKKKILNIIFLKL